MGRLRHIIACLLMAFLLPLCTPAGAGSRADSIPVSYNGYIRGFQVVDVSMILDQQADRYRGNIRIDVNALIGFFYKWEGVISVEGRVENDGRLRPTDYRTAWISTAKTGNGGITFDPQSDTANGFWEDKPDLEVPLEHRQNVLDPLTMFFVMQKALREQRYGLSEWRSYDGRHRADVHMTVMPPTQETIGERSFQAATVTTTYTPIAGFNPTQMETWPKSKSTLMFSDDDRHVLLLMKIETPNNTVMMRIKCADDANPNVVCP